MYTKLSEVGFFEEAFKWEVGGRAILPYAKDNIDNIDYDRIAEDFLYSGIHELAEVKDPNTGMNVAASLLVLEDIGRDFSEYALLSAMQCEKSMSALLEYLPEEKNLALAWRVKENGDISKDVRSSVIEYVLTRMIYQNPKTLELLDLKRLMKDLPYKHLPTLIKVINSSGVNKGGVDYEGVVNLAKCFLCPTFIGWKRENDVCCYPEDIERCAEAIINSLKAKCLIEKATKELGVVKSPEYVFYGTCGESPKPKKNFFQQLFGG